jgi:precorrin-4 methylase
MTPDLIPRATPVLITSPDPYKLAELVERESARRAIVVRGAIGMVDEGVWGVAVYQLRPLERRWVKPAVITGGVAAGFAALAWMGWLIVSAVAAVAASISLAAVLGILAVTGVVLRLVSHGGCETTVTVKHRHPR